MTSAGSRGDADDGSGADKAREHVTRWSSHGHMASRRVATRRCYGVFCR